MQVARNQEGGTALMALNVDSPVNLDTLNALSAEVGAGIVKAVTLVF